MKKGLLLILLTAALTIGLQRESQTDSTPYTDSMHASPVKPTEADLRQASTKAIKAIQKSQSVWYQRELCTSCHHQLLPEISIALARERGLPLDEKIASSNATQAFAYLKDLDSIVQGYDYIDVIADAWQLVAAQSAGLAPSIATSVEAQFILSRQHPDGSWPTIDDRPPQSYSNISTTAVSALALQSYLPPQLKKEKERSIRLAQTWLLKAQSRSTEERAFQLMGLRWTGAALNARSQAAQRLLAEQRSDGGWSQLQGLESDSYSTGEALVALADGGGIPTDNESVQRGLAFLLKTQNADGSWRVNSRLHPPAPVSPPYVNTDFPPFQHDQFISIMGTSWATAALLKAIPASSQTATRKVMEAEPAASDQPAWTTTALFGTESELRQLLEAGLKPNSKTKEGTTLLMFAARDPLKVKLLLDRGADVNVRSNAGLTALMVASRYRGNVEVLKLLLAKGAKLTSAGNEEVKNNCSAVFFAVMSGDLAMVRFLLDAGGKLERMKILGTFFSTPLNYAIVLGDTPLVDYLLSKGADVNEVDDDKLSALSWATISGRLNVVNTLLSRGARVNTVDNFGMTALLYAVSINYGDSEILSKLIAAGADLKAKNKEGLTALDLAKNYHHESMANLLVEKTASR